MIAQNEIDKLVKTIADSLKPEKIILFGSYGYGNPNDDSDLDLLVIVKKSKLPRYKRTREIRKKIWGMIDIPKDIMVYTQKEVNEWKEVEGAFITSIIKRGRILFENKERINS